MKKNYCIIKNNIKFYCRKEFIYKNNKKILNGLTEIFIVNSDNTIDLYKEIFYKNYKIIELTIYDDIIKKYNLPTKIKI
jgi:hypothetical protein